MSLHEFTWKNLSLPDFTWIYLNLPEFTWIYLNLLEFTWIYLNLPEFTWIYLNLPDFTWLYPNLPEWVHLCLLGVTWVNLGWIWKMSQTNTHTDRQRIPRMSRDPIGSNNAIACQEAITETLAPVHKRKWRREESKNFQLWKKTESQTWGGNAV